MVARSILASRAGDKPRLRTVYGEWTHRSVENQQGATRKPDRCVKCNAAVYFHVNVLATQRPLRWDSVDRFRMTGFRSHNLSTFARKSVSGSPGNPPYRCSLRDLGHLAKGTRLALAVGED